MAPEGTRLAWQHGHPGALWQRRFYDHFLRSEESVEATARYILSNPVRQGLVILDEVEVYRYGAGGDRGPRGKRR